MKTCDKCGHQNNDDAVFCFRCGHMLGFGNNLNSKTQITPQPPVRSSNHGSSSVLDKLNDFVGNDSNKPLKWTDLFSNVFKKHTYQQAEEIFIYGTRRTTPPLYAVSSDWPKPWLYSRVLLGLIVTFLLLKLCVDIFGNVNAVPGLMVIGSMAFPLALSMMFFEINVFRNISFYTVALVFLIGGGASLLLSLGLYSVILPDIEELGYLEAILISIIEETGKFFIIFWFLKKLPNCKYILNGLLIGAVVGAGFAAFESAGYAFQSLAEDIDSMYSIIYLRGFLSPGGHIAWSAMVGAAIEMCIPPDNRGVTLSQVLSDNRFWRIVLFPVLLHFIWDCPFMTDYCLIKLSALIIVAWVITLVLIQMGLKEVDKEAHRFN